MRIHSLLVVILAAMAVGAQGEEMKASEASWRTHDRRPLRYAEAAGPSRSYQLRARFESVWAKQAVRARIPQGTYHSAPARDGVVRDDFLVNADDHGGQRNQFDADVAVLGDGSFMAVWVECVNMVLWDVVGQKYDATGNAMGPRVRVSKSLSYNSVCPSIAALGENVVVAWSSYNEWDGVYLICGQLFDAQFDSLGPEFVINDASGPFIGAVNPSLAASEDGFVVAWEDYRNDPSFSDIYAQRYDATGSMIGANFMANMPDTTMNGQYECTVGMNAHGFIIAWEDESFYVYAQRYDSTGAAIGTAMYVGDDGGAALKRYPNIAVSDSLFALTWVDTRNGGGVTFIPDVYGQVYRCNGDSVGGNIKLNEAGVTYQYSEPEVTAADDGFLFSWCDDRTAPEMYFDIYGQRIDGNGVAAGANFLINEDAGTAVHNIPASGSNGGNTIVCWTDERNLNQDIYGQRYGFGGTPGGTNFMVSRDSMVGDQQKPACATNGNGNTMIVWQDTRNQRGWGNGIDIFAQICDSAGTLMGGNLLVNDTLLGDRYTDNPIVAALANGQFLVAWEDARNGMYDIYAQAFSEDGQPVGSNFAVNENPGTTWRWLPAIAGWDSGYCIAWMDFRNDDGSWSKIDVYAQRYDRNGTPLGVNFPVNDTAVTARMCGNVQLAYARDGRMAAVWQGGLDWEPNHIYQQLYSVTGEAVGANMQNSPAEGMQSCPALGAADTVFVTAWEDFVGGSQNVTARWQTFSGTVLDSGVTVNDDATGWGSRPSLLVHPMTGRSMVMWQSDVDGEDCDAMARVYDAPGTPAGPSMLMVRDGEPWWRQELYSGSTISGSGNRILLCWSDTRRELGYDVYAKVVEWDIEGQPPLIVSVDSLPDDPSAPFGPYPVAAVITDNSGVQRAILHYEVNGAVDSLTMSAAGVDSFAATIPEQAIAGGQNETIRYWVSAEDASRNRAESSQRSFVAGDLTGVSGWTNGQIPAVFALSCPRPNPTRGMATLEYSIAKAGPVQFTLYNISGQAVKTMDCGTKAAGWHKLTLDVRGMSQGVYLCKMKAGARTAIQKIVFTK